MNKLIFVFLGMLLFMGARSKSPPDRSREKGNEISPRAGGGGKSVNSSIGGSTISVSGVGLSEEIKKEELLKKEAGEGSGVLVLRPSQNQHPESSSPNSASEIGAILKRKARPPGKTAEAVTAAKENVSKNPKEEDPYQKEKESYLKQFKQSGENKK